MTDVSTAGRQSRFYAVRRNPDGYHTREDGRSRCSQCYGVTVSWFHQIGNCSPMRERVNAYPLLSCHANGPLKPIVFVVDAARKKTFDDTDPTRDWA
jgi:hypothetical protein